MTLRLPHHSLTLGILIMGGTSVMKAQPAPIELVSDVMTVRVDPASGAWSLADSRSGVNWPSSGMAAIGSATALSGDFSQSTLTRDDQGRPIGVTLSKNNGVSANIALVDQGRAVAFSFAGDELRDLRVFHDALDITDSDQGYVVVPCREGLLFPANSGKSFKRTFGTSDYEGCHMNMLGFVKNSSAMVMDWDDAYVFPELQSTLPNTGDVKQRLSCSVDLRRSARSIRLSPLGNGDWNTIADGYRRIAEQKKLAVTMADKIRRNPHAELMNGAANVKLWTCLARRMSEDSKSEESVKVHWTFEEAAQLAEHLQKDLLIDKCLFIIGGWTEGGYDCRHPDALPANPECGGNEALANAVRRIQNLGYVAAFHDNYQDMYADAPSWDPSLLEKDAKGNVITGGRWLGGRAYMVCAPKQLELAQRPQNLTEVQRLFGPWCYFIDTTYAVGPRECQDPKHPIGRNEDILWKQRLSDFSRETFGLFGSECGREWALPHSDWFEGLVGVSGRYFHNLEPEKLGAEVIPFWEMVYHDCQIAHGKYGYQADEAAEYVAHHAICARTLHYHSMPDHLYWRDEQQAKSLNVVPSVKHFASDGERAFTISYSWKIEDKIPKDWRAFVHFVDGQQILFQNDHALTTATNTWQPGQLYQSEDFRVEIPATVKADSVMVYIGLFNLKNVSARAKLLNADGQGRICLGTLTLRPELKFTPGAPPADKSRAAFTRSDNGWAEGMHPMDIFIKNTHELLGPIHAATAHLRLNRLDFLTPDRLLKRAVYGEGAQKVTVIVNTSGQDHQVPSLYGGNVVLPTWGVLAEAPRFTAFYAKRWGGKDYPDGALFSIHAAADDEDLANVSKIRVFHGFGAAEISWRGHDATVPRESVIELK